MVRSSPGRVGVLGFGFRVYGVYIQCARGGCAFCFRNRGTPTNRALASACSHAPTAPVARREASVSNFQQTTCPSHPARVETKLPAWSARLGQAQESWRRHFKTVEEEAGHPSPTAKKKGRWLPSTAQVPGICKRVGVPPDPQGSPL